MPIEVYNQLSISTPPKDDKEVVRAKELRRNNRAVKKTYSQAAGGGGTGPSGGGPYTRNGIYKKIKLHVTEPGHQEYFYKFAPVAGSRVPVSVLIDVLFPTTPTEERTKYTRTVILDFRDLGGNTRWVRWYDSDAVYRDKTMIPGISLWRNGVHNPEFFRADYQWPTMRAQDGLPDLTNGHPNPYPSWQGQSATVSQLGKKGLDLVAEYFAAMEGYSRARLQRQKREDIGWVKQGGPRFFASALREVAWYVHRMACPAGQVFRLDFEMSRLYDLCLVTMRVFGHIPVHSRES